MTNTVETIQTPSKDEYGIVATFSEQSLRQLSNIQDQLHEYLGDAIWLTPQRALHSTLMEIVCDREYPTPRNELFTNWYHQYSHQVTETLGDLPPITITFSEIEISARAIIVRSVSSKAYNDIRSKLLSKIELPKGTKLPPDITHCTLARFNSALNLEETIRQLRNIQCNITENVTSFKLLKDLGPPTFEPKTIQLYNLHT